MLTRRCMRPAVLVRSVLLLVAAAISNFVSGAQAQDHTTQTVKVIAEGCAPGVTPASRNAALDEARRQAVWLWVESTLEREPSDDFLALMDYLDTYTASSRLLKTTAEAGRTCVEAEIFLYEWPLRTDLAAVLFRQRRTPPVVALMLVENDLTTGARRFQDATLSATAMVDAFRSKGFGVIEPAQARTAFSEREIMAMLDGGPRAMARFGSDLRADAVVVIESKLSARPEPGGGDTLRARAELTMFVVEAAGGALSDNGTATAEVTSADAASGLRVAAGDAVYKLRDRAAVAAVLASQGSDAERFELTIEGIRDFVAAERIADRLRGFDGVEDASLVSARNGTARIQFRYTGRIAAVVEYLESGAAGQPLRAARVVDREMYFNAVP